MISLSFTSAVSTGWVAALSRHNWIARCFYQSWHDHCLHSSSQLQDLLWLHEPYLSLSPVFFLFFSPASQTLNGLHSHSVLSVSHPFRMEIKHGITRKLLVLKIFNHVGEKKKSPGVFLAQGRQREVDQGELEYSADLSRNEGLWNDLIRIWVMHSSNELLSLYYVYVYEIMVLCEIETCCRKDEWIHFPCLNRIHVLNENGGCGKLWRSMLESSQE